jgi:hypothetical protein
MLIHQRKKVVLAAALVLLLAQPALAAAPAAPPAPSPAGSAASPAASGSSSPAVALYEEGVKLAEKKDYKAAEAKFLGAWAIQRSYDVAANLGEVEMQLDKPADAAALFTYALANFPLGGKPQTREWITGRLKDARGKVFVLTWTVNVPGAEVRIDGKPSVARAGEEVFLPAGDHTVDVTAPDHDPWSQKLAAAAGGSKALKVELSQPKKSLLPGMVAGGMGLVTLVAGVTFYVVSTDKYDEAARLSQEIKSETGLPRPCGEPVASPKCATLKSAAETSDSLYGPGVALLIGGSVLAAAGAAYLGYTLMPASPKASAGGPRVTSFGVRGTGLFVQGSF